MGGVEGATRERSDLGRAVERYVRLLGWATATGAIVGLVVFGVGGRVVMRILAVTSSQAAQGAFTDAGAEIGDISLGGTLALFVFGGLGFGALGGVLYAVIRPLLPERRVARLTCCGALGAVVGTVVLVNPGGTDFGILDPLWLAVMLSTLLGALGGLAFCLVGDRLRPWYETARIGGVRYLAFSAMFVLVLPVFAVATIVAGVVFVVLQGVALPAWTRRLGQVGAVALVAVLAVVAVGKISDVEGRSPRSSDFVEPEF